MLDKLNTKLRSISCATERVNYLGSPLRSIGATPTCTAHAQFLMRNHYYANTPIQYTNKRAKLKHDLYHIRPDQINLLLLGFSEPKIGPTDRNKNINLMGVAIDHLPVSHTYTCTYS